MNIIFIKNKIFLPIIILIILFSGNSIAEITVKDINSKNNLVTIKIQGEIKYKDDEKFVEILNTIIKNNKIIKNNSIQLNSNGGNLSAAMGIGKLIRDRNLNTFLGPNSRCVSACVEILIGGNQRVVLGTVGIHRGIGGMEPYEGDYKEWVERHQQKLYDYYDYMNVSAVIYFISEATSNWSMRILTKKEIVNWNISGTDEVFDTLWLRNSFKITGFNEDKISKSVYKYSKKCRVKAYSFQDTYWDCQMKYLNSSF